MQSNASRPEVALPVAGDPAPVQAWQTPRLECFGPVRKLTAGGSAQNYSEVLDCKNQAIFLRC